MNKFEKIYNEILNDLNTSLPNEFGINEINEVINPKYKWFGMYQILNEYVEEKETTPVPKQFFIEICKNIKTKKFQILTYPYEKILEMLDNYQYELIDDFKNNLINGTLYIISSKQISDNLLNSEMNNIFNILSNNFNEDEIEQIIQQCSKNVKGITSTLKLFDFKYKNIFIFINQDKIVNRSWTITLEHELTHFIHRIIGYEKSLKRSAEIPGNGYGLYLQNKQFFDMIFNINDDQKISNNILEFIKYIIKPREQDTSIKHILMNFQREYERNNKEISSFKNDPKLKNNINQRINWLNNLLEKISNKSYFQSSEWKENLNLINQDWNNLSINDKMKYDFIHAIIGYLIYNKILFQRNIKQKLTEHFQTFKYRDN